MINASFVRYIYLLEKTRGMNGVEELCSSLGFSWPRVEGTKQKKWSPDRRGLAQSAGREQPALLSALAQAGPTARASLTGPATRTCEDQSCSLSSPNFGIVGSHLPGLGERSTQVLQQVSHVSSSAVSQVKYETGQLDYYADDAEHHVTA